MNQQLLASFEHSNPSRFGGAKSALDAHNLRSSGTIDLGSYSFTVKSARNLPGMISMTINARRRGTRESRQFQAVCDIHERTVINLGPAKRDGAMTAWAQHVSEKVKRHRS